MIPVVVYWTEYTATRNGQVFKFVPCEECSTEYVYVLERECVGLGTSFYSLNEEGAAEHAVSAADDTLKQSLENDFDAVPCPHCGHYQRFMFPKLYETKSPWGLAARFIVVVAGCFAAIAATFRSIGYVQQPSEHAFGKMVGGWTVLVVLALIGFVLFMLERSKVRASTRIRRIDKPASKRAKAGPRRERRSMRCRLNRQGTLVSDGIDAASDGTPLV